MPLSRTLIAAAVAQGLSPTAAERLAAATLHGAGVMAGAQTQPAVLAYANQRTKDDPRVNLGYAINAAMIQLFWFRSVRDNIPLLFVLSLLVNVGMWLERFVIIVTSLSRDFLPSSWDMYVPTRWDFAMFAGTIGLFLSLFFLFIRFLPAIAMFEMRTIVPEAKLKTDQHHG